METKVRHTTMGANCAKAIRQELKATFKDCKFSVVSRRGSSVRVYWVDGPSTKSVESILDKYEYGHFDGMDDMYHYSNRRDDIPQVKFVFAEREMSDVAKEKLIAANYIGEAGTYEADRRLYSAFLETSF